MFKFQWRSEGDPVREGFNVYPLDDKGSIGFLFRRGDMIFKFRYSKIMRRFYIKKYYVD